MRNGLRLNRSRLRIVLQTRASWSTVSRLGCAASATALNAPELQPTTPPGVTPDSRSAFRTPTLQAPRLPPPPSTKTSRPGRRCPDRRSAARRRHQARMRDIGAVLGMLPASLSTSSVTDVVSESIDPSAKRTSVRGFGLRQSVTARWRANGTGECARYTDVGRLPDARECGAGPQAGARVSLELSPFLLCVAHI